MPPFSTVTLTSVHRLCRNAQAPVALQQSQCPHSSTTRPKPLNIVLQDPRYAYVVARDAQNQRGYLIFVSILSPCSNRRLILVLLSRQVQSLHPSSTWPRPPTHSVLHSKLSLVPNSANAPLLLREGGVYQRRIASNRFPVAFHTPYSVRSLLLRLPLSSGGSFHLTVWAPSCSSSCASKGPVTSCWSC